MDQWDIAELIVLAVLLIGLTLADWPKGAAFYRTLFNVSVTISFGLLYSVPLWLIAYKPAWTTSSWFMIGTFFFYKVIFIVSVLLLIKRDRFYFWVVRKLR
jgi:hypothetical protein